MTRSQNEVPAPCVDVSDLVWLQTSFIGDIVLTSAAISLARERLPRARQHLVTTSVGRELLDGMPELASVTIFDKKSPNLPKTFRRVKRQLEEHLHDPSRTTVLQAHRSYRSSLLARYLGHYTIGYQESSGGVWADERVPRVAPLHESARIGLLLEPLGVSRADIIASRPRLPSASRDESALDETFLERGPVVGLAPGSVWPTKRWSVERYGKLARRLVDRGFRVVLLGSRGERGLCYDMARFLDGVDGWRNLCGQTSLKDLRRVYPRLSLLVSNDSSPVHFASAYGVPTVAVFGATTPEMGFGPLAEKSRVAQVGGLSCRPCSAHGPVLCPARHFRCMRDVTVDEVERASLAALGATENR